MRQRSPRILVSIADQPSPQQRRIVGWWGIASMTAAILAAAFLPAAMMGTTHWAIAIESVTPMWIACCFIGVAAGLRGMQRQHYATQRQRIIALLGIVLSLGIFIAFTTISLTAGE